MSARKLITAPSRIQILRGLVFCLGFFIILFTEYYGNWPTSMASPNSILPYFIILGVIFYPLLFMYRNSAIPVISRCCVPVGVLVSALNSLWYLGNLTGDREADLMAARLAFSPLALGVLMSFLLPLLETEAGALYEPKKKESSIVVTLLIAALLLVWGWFFSEPLKFLIDPFAIIVCLFVTLASMVYPGGESLKFSEKLLNAGLFSCVVAAVLAIARYSSAAPLGPEYISPQALTGFCSMAYASLLLLTATIWGGQCSMDTREARYFDWHIIESWSFLALMLLGPATMLELINF